MLNLKRTPIAIAAFLTLALVAMPAWALLIMDTSTAPGIEIDAEFTDNHIFNVPAGAVVRLTKTTGANSRVDTHTIIGPYKGTLGEYIRRECWRPGAHCGGNAVQGGGTRSVNPSQGGVRGLRRSN